MAHALVKSLLLDDCGDVKERVAEAHDAEVGGRHDYRVSCAREQLRQTRMSVGRQAAEGVRQGRRHCTFVGCNTNHVDLGTVTFQNGKSPAEARFVWGFWAADRGTLSLLVIFHSAPHRCTHTSIVLHTPHVTSSETPAECRQRALLSLLRMQPQYRQPLDSDVHPCHRPAALATLMRSQSQSHSPRHRFRRHQRRAADLPGAVRRVTAQSPPP